MIIRLRATSLFRRLRVAASLTDELKGLVTIFPDTKDNVWEDCRADDKTDKDGRKALESFSSHVVQRVTARASN